MSTAAAERAAWLVARQQHVTASDLPAILGVSPWRSAYAVWAEKTGRVPAEDLDEIEAVRWGQILEDPVAREFARRSGRQIVDHGRTDLRISPLHPRLGATLDREIVPVSEPTPGALEIKTSGAHALSDWEAGVPLHVEIQVQAQLATTGWAWGVAAALIGGQRYVDHVVARNDTFVFEVLLPAVDRFWSLVQSDTPPEADGSESTQRAIKLLHPRDNGTTVFLPEESAEWVAEREAARAEIKAASERLAAAEAKIKTAIGDATFGVLPDGTKVSWKTQTRGGYQVAPTESRVLRIHARKG